MKLIHTYVPTRVGSEINKITLQNMILSVLCAKVHFNSISLYTDETTSQIVKKIGIPYDEIITEPFINFESNTFSIPKLITYSLQDESFIHIDIDTFIYKRIEVSDTIPYFYAHPDIDMSTISNFQMSLNLYQTYLKNAHMIKNRIPEDIKKYINFNDIPNMNVFGTIKPEIVSESAKICLKIYNDNREFFDSEYYNACIIEQLLIPSVIKKLNETHYENHYLIESKNVFRIETNDVDLESIELPFNISFDGNIIGIDNEFSLFQLVNYDYRTIVHLGGYKNLDIFQFLVRETILDRFNGIEYIIKLDKLFVEPIPGQEISDKFYNHMLNKTANKISKLRTKKNII